MNAMEKRASEQSGIAAVYERQCGRVYRVCFSYLKNEADAADMMQETFLRYMVCADPPEQGDHETAWFVMTAGNLCKNHIRDHRGRISPEGLDENLIADSSAYPQTREVLRAVLDLPDKYKTAVYLYYYEGMDTQTIAHFIGEKHSTVRSRLKRARELLKKRLGDDING